MNRYLAPAVVTAGALLATLAPTVAQAAAPTADKYDKPLTKVTCKAGNVRKAAKRSSGLVGVVYKGQTVRILKGLENKNGNGFSHWQIRFKSKADGAKHVGWVIFDCVDLYRQ